MAQNQAIVNIRELNPDLKVGLAYAMKDKKTISSGTIAGYGVFNQTEVPEAAVEWVKALTGETGMYLIDTTLNFIAPRFSVDARMAEDMDDPFYKRAVENSAHSTWLVRNDFVRIEHQLPSFIKGREFAHRNRLNHDIPDSGRLFWSCQHRYSCLLRGELAQIDVFAPAPDDMQFLYR